VTDQDQVMQIKCFDELGKVIGIAVHVVAVPGLV
jgi:hypothetical protein